ncbi:DUF6036 family nucleotidyltransferase [Pricia sp. S334]|uniref:DUF6036 family nucleotidyltransferase n=1 Tax=Pricia mediterranea TaxID=3076079 RepID=A0ABU3L370_9FLAO|nr:DUF6036 family nucleotidyltransferase [Pricia sp. S334]MDT7828200.1 DUF6036 family nucleotidyltransferase [Pricia sp. S334]
MNNWKDQIDGFIRLCNDCDVRMLMVGGGAVNFHGYQRHSADVDFWIDMNPENLKNLVRVFRAMDYEIDDFPNDVKEQRQNISIKFSPLDLDLELITNFSVNKTFEEAYRNSEIVSKEENSGLKWRVLSFDDLITSKIKSGRPKDLLDVQELQKVKRG